MKPRTLKIDPEFAGLIPPLSSDEREQLEVSLLADGCIDALAVWHDTLIDGHNRYDICHQHGIEFGVTNINLKTRDDAITWIVQHQLGRRNLSDFARVELALRIKPIIEAKAKAHQKAGGGAVRQKSDEPVRVDQQIADAAHVSKDTVRKVEAIKKSGSDVLVAAAKAEEISINKAAKIANLPKKKQPDAMKAAKAPKPKPAKPEKEDDGTDELADELVAADKQIRSLTALVESLKKSDLAAEVIKWRENFAKLEKRLQQCLATKAEAEKQAKYSTGLLAKIRKALKVEKNSEILPALES